MVDIETIRKVQRETAISYIPQREISSLKRRLNRSTWFNKEYCCLDLVAALWYHFYQMPILVYSRKVYAVHNTIIAARRYFQHLEMNKNSISFKSIPKLPNLTIILQSDGENLADHASIVLLNGRGEKYIMEKRDVVKIVPIKEWKTSRDSLPYYAKLGFDQAWTVYGIPKRYENQIKVSPVK